MISFIILSWNSEKYLERCFDSVIDKCRAEGIPFEIIDIDNGSTDGTMSLLKSYSEKFPDNFSYMGLATNRGTTFTRNLGFREARGSYVCVLDSDTEITDGSLCDILHWLSRNGKTGIVAPRLVFPDGSVQNSVKMFPTLWQKVRKIPAIVLKLRVPKDDFYSEFPFEAKKKVDSAISACWFFERRLLEGVGYLDENIFYAPEDLDYCLRVYKSGRNVLYWPELTVIHHTQQISHRSPLSKVSLSHFAGLFYYYRKHGGWFSRPDTGSVS